jgi:hypothetical protein
VAACGGAWRGPATVDTADAGQLAVLGDTVELTLTGLTSVSVAVLEDQVSFAVEDGGAWVDVLKSVPDEHYWLDGDRYRAGRGRDPFAPTCREVSRADGVILSATLTGARRIGDRDGLPAYATVDLRGDVRVSFSYSLDGCATFRTFTGTVHR